MMPKVTLLKAPYQNYLVPVGNRTIEFFGGEKKPCPVHVALRLQRLKNDDGPMFLVEDMPKIVSEGQNVNGEPYQQRFFESGTEN